MPAHTKSSDFHIPQFFCWIGRNTETCRSMMYQSIHRYFLTSSARKETVRIPGARELRRKCERRNKDLWSGQIRIVGLDDLTNHHDQTPTAQWLSHAHYHILPSFAELAGSLLLASVASRGWSSCNCARVESCRRPDAESTRSHVRFR